MNQKRYFIVLSPRAGESSRQALQTMRKIATLQNACFEQEADILADAAGNRISDEKESRLESLETELADYLAETAAKKGESPEQIISLFGYAIAKKDPISVFDTNYEKPEELLRGVKEIIYGKNPEILPVGVTIDRLKEKMVANKADIALQSQSDMPIIIELGDEHAATPASKRIHIGAVDATLVRIHPDQLLHCMSNDLVLDRANSLSVTS